MSKVEMSLQEYNQLMEELSMYKEIVNAVINPKIDSWDLNWFQQHPESTLSISSSNLMETLSLKSRDYIRQEIADRISFILEEYRIKGEINPPHDYNIYLCGVSHETQETVEEV